jgi:hypothetical protein
MRTVSLFNPLDLMAVGTRRASARSARSSKHKTATKSLFR